jgi:hypothetical protein
VQPTYRRLPSLVLAATLALAASSSRDADAAGTESASPSDPRKRARALYQRGTEAAQRGKLAEAAQLFAQAAELVPHAATHVAAGRSFLASKDEVAAADHFARALSLGAPEAERADVESTLASLRGKLGWVEVSGETGSARLDDRRALPIPSALHGEPGKHTLTFTLAAGEGHLEIELRAGEGVVAEAALVRDEPEPAPTPPPSRPSTGPSPILIGGLAGLGLGVVGGGVTLGLGLAANGARDDFLASRTQSDFDGATALETSTNVALGLSVGLAVVGAALVSVALLVDDEAPLEATNGGVAWRF